MTFSCATCLPFTNSTSPVHLVQLQGLPRQGWQQSHPCRIACVTEPILPPHSLHIPWSERLCASEPWSLGLTLPESGQSPARVFVVVRSFTQLREAYQIPAKEMGTWSRMCFKGAPGSCRRPRHHQTPSAGPPARAQQRPHRWAPAVATRCGRAPARRSRTAPHAPPAWCSRRGLNSHPGPVLHKKRRASGAGAMAALSVGASRSDKLQKGATTRPAASSLRTKCLLESGPTVFWFWPSA